MTVQEVYKGEKYNDTCIAELDVFSEKDGWLFGGRRLLWITEYDSKGNRTYLRDSDGYEQWWEYDDRGNMIHRKDNKGYEKWWKYEYDDRGNVIHYKDDDGGEMWYEYDDKGNRTRSKHIDSSGKIYEYWYEYTFWENGAKKTMREYTSL